MLLAVALETDFEPLPLRPLPAVGRAAAPLRPAGPPSEGEISQGCIDRHVLAAIHPSC
jgi:hypothetical protein